MTEGGERFWQYYPYPLLIQFTLLVLTSFCYLFDILLICFSKTFNKFIVRLFFYQCLAQSFIFIPQIVTPYLTAPFSNPIYNPKNMYDDDPIINPDSLLCKFQGVSILSGWLITSFISIFILHCINNVLKGVELEWNFRKELKMLAIIYTAGVLPWGLYAAFANFEVLGWKYAGQMMYCYCSANLGVEKVPTAFTFGLFLTNATILAATITLSVSIRKQQKKIKNLGLPLDRSMMGIDSIAFFNVILWTINGVVKLLDSLNMNQMMDKPVLNAIWITLNCLYDCNGIITTTIFLFTHLPLMKSEMNERFYLFLHFVFRKPCERRKPKQVVFSESFQTYTTQSDQDNYDSSATDSNGLENKHNLKQKFLIKEQV